MALLFVPHAIDSELPSSPSPYYRTLLTTSSTDILLRSPNFTDARAQWENEALARSKRRHRGTTMSCARTSQPKAGPLEAMPTTQRRARNRSCANGTGQWPYKFPWKHDNADADQDSAILSIETRHRSFRRQRRRT